MLIDFIVGLGLFIGLLTILAHAYKKPELGIFASILLLLLGLFVIDSGVEYKTGETTTTAYTYADNLTTLTVAETVFDYGNPADVSTYPFSWFLSLLLLLLGIYGVVYNWIDMMSARG